MGTVIISTLQRGGNGTSPFPISIQDDLKIPHVIVPDEATRLAIPEWKRIAFMTCYQIDANTTYRLGVNITIAGQVWTEEGASSDFQLLSEKNQPSGYVGLNTDGFIDPQYIRSIFVQDYFVVADQAERLALVAVTGDICHQLDTGQVFIKKNNNTPPTVDNDWADITSAATVTSVNGMIGAVEITISNLLSYGTNQSQFNTAVNNTPAVSGLNSQVGLNTADIINIYNLISSLTGGATSLPLWNPLSSYAVGKVVLYDPGTGRKILYRCIVTSSVGTPPTNTVYWEVIGDFYTQDEIDSFLADKADLVGGKVPLSQLPVTELNKYFVVADLGERNTLATSLEVDDRVVVMEAMSTLVPDGGVAEYIYKPSDPNADGLGYVFISAASTRAFDWNRVIKKIPQVGETIGGDSIKEGLEEAFFGPIYPTVNLSELNYGMIGNDEIAFIQGEVIPNEVDTIDAIRIVRVSDSAIITTVTPATPPTATPISYSAPSITMIDGTTESYKVEVDYHIGSLSGLVVSEILNFVGLYPILIGNGTHGLTGSGIFALNKIKRPQENTYFEGFTGTERLYFAFPNTFDDLISVIDQHKDELFGSLFSSTPSTVSISSTGLTVDWTLDYKVYESNYDCITNNERFGFLFQYEELGSGSIVGLTFLDKAKLDSIEFGAETNPSAFEIKQLYESNSDTNAFNDGYKTKLDGIENGAEVNDTASEVKTKYESNADTNVFTDTEKAKLAGIDLGLIGDVRKDVYDINDNGIIDNAENLTIEVLNITGNIIPRGTILYVSSYSVGQNLLAVILADKDTPILANGVAAEEIAIGASGKMLIQGILYNMNTSGLPIDSIIYLDTLGTFTSIRPSAGLIQRLGLVAYEDAVNGAIYFSLANVFNPDLENWVANRPYVKNEVVLAVYPNPLNTSEVTEIAIMIRCTTNHTSSSLIVDSAAGYWEATSGDLLSFIYDPDHISGDVFDMDNMKDGSAHVAMTIAERSKLSGLESPTFKGYFNTPNLLNATYPIGQTGWSAVVLYENDEVTPNGNLWIWITTPSPQWSDTGLTSIGGDMNTGVYDPTSVAGDAFLMDNFEEGSDPLKLFFTNTERSKLAAFSTAASYYLKTEVDSLLAVKAAITYVDSQDALKMSKSVYDPTNKNGDAFLMTNMVEGVINKILTDTERTNISDNTTARHTHANKALLDSLIAAGDGESYLSDDGTYQDAAKAGIHNGTCIQQQDIFVVESGGLVYADVEKVGGGDLQVYFGNDSYYLNCTSGAGVSGRARIQLIPGTITTPQVNLVIVILSGGVPTLSVQTIFEDLPLEFAWIGIIAIRNAANVAIEGPIVLQRFTDAATHNSRGRLAYLGERIRIHGSQWWSGVDPTVTITPNPSALDSVNLTVLTGLVYQLHRQTFPAYDIAVSGIYVTNVSGTGLLQNYQKVLNLNAINEYSNGSLIQNGDYFNLTVYGVINKTTATCKLLVNPSSGGYLTSNAAYNDSDNLSNLSPPRELRTVAFLIARIPLRYTTASNGTLAFINPVGKPQWIDLRGQVMDVSNESGLGQSTINTAEDVTYSNIVSGLSATNVQQAIDILAPLRHSHLMGSGWSETTTAVVVGPAWVELPLSLTLSSANQNLAIKGLYRVGHNLTGKTFRCRIDAQISTNKIINDQTFRIAIAKNGTVVSEGFARVFFGGNLDGSWHTLSVNNTINLTSTDYVSVFAFSSPTGGSYNIQSIQISVSGFEII